MGAQNSISNSSSERGIGFKEPAYVEYILDSPGGIHSQSSISDNWIRAYPARNPNQKLLLGRRLFIQVAQPEQLNTIIQGRALKLVNIFGKNLFVFEANDARTAMEHVLEIMEKEGVIACYPDMRRRGIVWNAYAPYPKDALYSRQIYLENRNRQTGFSSGSDVNVRGAWPVSLGEGVVVAIADMGVDMQHAELLHAVQNNYHKNFIHGSIPESPIDDVLWHGTAIAGVIAAAHNDIGICGIAPGCQLANWVMLEHEFDGWWMPSTEQMAEMFQYQSNHISIQNHSWGFDDPTQYMPSIAVQTGISNAITLGRNGLGEILLMASGNSRGKAYSCADNGYLANPWFIAVGAVDNNGVVANYSNPGANMLIACPGGTETTGLFTTDLVGIHGANTNLSNAGDYMTEADGFAGTSASTAIASGITALILSANPQLTYRDVQQLFILSSRLHDLTDPDLQTNGAGLMVSRNVGYGIPDAGMAVKLAKRWKNRPPMIQRQYVTNITKAIPYGSGSNTLFIKSGEWNTLISTPELTLTDAPYPFVVSTPDLPLVSVGLATNAILTNLIGKAALIQRGSNTFKEKIQFAAAAGAQLVVVYNNTDLPIEQMGTKSIPIPAVFISQQMGQKLIDMLNQGQEIRVQFRPEPFFELTVPESILLEHVSCRVLSDHIRRGDLYLNLVSPSGTRSELQRPNGDYSQGPDNWPYFSTQFFYEPGAGVWRFYINDLQQGATGFVLSCELKLYGVPIVDEDRDGLEDVWERKYFGNLAYGQRDDVDHDGWNNMKEQILGMDPSFNETKVELTISTWSPNIIRLSWPGLPQSVFEIWHAYGMGQSMNLLTNLPGRFPENEWFVPVTNSNEQYFQIRSKP